MQRCGCGTYVQEGFFCVRCRMNSTDDGFIDYSEENELTPEEIIMQEKKRIAALEKKAKKKRDQERDDL